MCFRKKKALYFVIIGRHKIFQKNVLKPLKNYYNSYNLKRKLVKSSGIVTFLDLYDHFLCHDSMINSGNFCFIQKNLPLWLGRKRILK